MAPSRRRIAAEDGNADAEDVSARVDATIAATATATATRARDDDEGTGTTTFGAFGTLPDELVVRVLEKCHVASEKTKIAS